MSVSYHVTPEARLTNVVGTTSCRMWRTGYSPRYTSDRGAHGYVRRFGDGSDLLREGDKTNIWSIIEDGMV